jgi:hypothetical protein
MTEVTKTILNTITDSFNEMHRLMPDSILFGSALLYFLTHNYAFGIFSIFICEIIGTHKLISWVSTDVFGPAKHVNANIQKCHVGYRTSRTDYKKIFSHDSFPSYGMFSIASIGTYLALAMLEFSKTLYAMDQSIDQNKKSQEWASRCPFAYCFIISIIIIFMLFRWNSCESFGELSIAIILAFITGISFFHINKKIFGEEAMNFLGLPYLASKESNGSPIYICAETHDA